MGNKAMGFLDPLIVRYDVSSGEWLLEKELQYEAADGTIYTIPSQFRTDFASVPRILWSIFPPTGPWIRAAVLHDHLLVKRIVPKDRADDLFSEASESDGVKPWQRRSMYAAVKAFSRQGHYK